MYKILTIFVHKSPQVCIWFLARVEPFQEQLRSFVQTLGNFKVAAAVIDDNFQVDLKVVLLLYIPGVIGQFVLEETADKFLKWMNGFKVTEKCSKTLKVLNDFIP